MSAAGTGVIYVVVSILTGAAGGFVALEAYFQ
jgi:hypothetical protein